MTHLGQSLPLFQEEVHQNAIDKGFYDTVENQSVVTKIALVHAELSEALEEYRNGHAVDDVRYEDGKPEGFAVELADAAIRLFDLAEYVGLDLWALMVEKHNYNMSRPHRHGGKRI